MGRIRVLPGELVALISAGEVIENPASIVKELIENALDAEATRIDIDVREGGIEYISVSDNGTGILREDCTVCLKRHSTSKVSTREDIDGITTYGFRGEALASVAAVAEMRITTKSPDDGIGTVIVSRVGEDPVITDGARPQGTTVEVFRLFEEVPARRKHLESPRVEGQRVMEAVMRHAALRPEIGFRLTRDGQRVLDCPSGQRMIDRLTTLWGVDIANSLVSVDHHDQGVRVQGFVARPPVSRGNRGREYVSINKRPIIDHNLSTAIESAYRTVLMKGQFPIFALDITLQYNDVDVNVHPTKREIRILEPERVARTVRQAVEEALFPKAPEYEDTTLDEFDHSGVPGVTERPPAGGERQGSEPRAIEDVPLFEQTLLETPTGDDSSEPVEFLQGTFRIVGQIHNLYILLEFDDGLLIVDQHAAHERILYERLKRELEEGAIAVQELLQPIILNLSVDDSARIMEMRDDLHGLGYDIESFGGNDIAVSAIPEILGKRATESEMVSFIDRAVEIGTARARETFMDELVKLTACHSAIRAGQKLSMEDIRSLIQDLTGVEKKYNCCHGRPSMLKIYKRDLDRRFGRLGPEALARFRARHGLSS
ncbi:MAG: DNA mismatch repair endonuclease MutL [Candidatus Thorarchaeota archaeon]